MKTVKSNVGIALIGAATILISSFILSYKGVSDETSTYFILMTTVIFSLLISSNKNKLSCKSDKRKA